MSYKLQREPLPAVLTWREATTSIKLLLLKKLAFVFLLLLLLLECFDSVDGVPWRITWSPRRRRRRLLGKYLWFCLHLRSVHPFSSFAWRSLVSGKRLCLKYSHERWKPQRRPTVGTRHNTTTILMAPRCFPLGGMCRRLHSNDTLNFTSPLL